MIPGPAARGVAGVLGLLLCVSLLVAAPRPTLTDARAVDRLLATPRGGAPDRAILEWAGRAGLPELLFVLRHSPAELGALEPELVRQALERTPPARTALRARLVARLAVAAPRRARALLGELSADPAVLGLRAYASPFRVAALLPDSGDYQSYGREVRAGLEAGLALRDAELALPLELASFASGSDQPAVLAAALDSATGRCAVVVGELLSVPTLALATAARLSGFPLLSPTATDESVGSTAPSVFQIGPSGLQRGAALALAVMAGRTPRIGILVSSARVREALPLGFERAAVGLGASVVWRDRYAPGTLNFQAQSRALLERKVEVLLWDGDSREAEALFRQLARDRVQVRVCGGESLSPEQFHSETVPLLEGVRYVADDWRLTPAREASLDSLVRARGDTPIPSLNVRGYLAAQLIADAVAGGALCGEEIVAALASRVGDDPYLRAHGFLDCTAVGARLQLFTVSHGHGVPSQ